jgi:hypothetical protein
MKFRPGAHGVRRCLGSVVTLLCAAACAPAPEQAQHTVQDYRQDRILRQGELARCANDPGTLKSSPDCVNAQAAERAAGVGSLRDLPPLQLPGNK